MKFLFHLFALLFFLSVFFFLRIEHQEYGYNFIRVPIRYLSLLNAPHIQIKIENRKYNVLLDTGAEMGLSFPKKTFRSIKKKKTASPYEYIDLKGNHYLSKKFRSSDVCIGEKLIISGLSVKKEHVDFTSCGRNISSKNFTYWFWNKLDSFFSNGKIGVDAFRGAVCYFDFPSSTFCMAQNIAALLKEAKCSLEGFIQAPFTLEPYGAVVQFSTEFGVKKFLLDTGSTISIINQNQDDQNVLIESAKTCLNLMGYKLGDWNFRIMKISEFSPGIDGVLGVDFFKKHLICIDFAEHMAYIRAV